MLNPPSKFTRVAIRHWDHATGATDPLGGEIELSLGNRRTLLVGRNGAGKSAILEGFYAAASKALGRRVAGPSHFECDLGPLHYWFRQRWSEDADREFWSEDCARDGRQIWHVAHDDVTIPVSPRAPQMRIASRAGLLALPSPPTDLADARVVRAALKGMRLLKSGVPRTRRTRGLMALRRARGRLAPDADGDPRIGRLAVHIANLESRPERIGEFKAIGRRIGLFEDVNVLVYSAADEKDADSFTDIEVDGVNLGLLSDGTLRVCEVLFELVNPAAKTLLIEEPETGIHPGLLRKLLAELDAYADEKQMVISTHSPVVVDWARAEELRLVSRAGGTTRVDAIGESDLDALRRYLQDEGALSEFVFLRSAE